MNVHNHVGGCDGSFDAVAAVVNYATIDGCSLPPYHREPARSANGGWCASWVASMEHHSSAASGLLRKQSRERVMLSFLQRQGVLPLFLNDVGS